MVSEQQTAAAALVATAGILLLCSSPVAGRWGTQTHQRIISTNEVLAGDDDPYGVSKTSARRVRSVIPAENHTGNNNDVGMVCVNLSPTSLPLPDDLDLFTFGQVTVPGWAVFYRSEHSVAFVKTKIVVPGHILVMSLNSTAKRVVELSPVELADMFLTAQKVQRGVELFHGVSSSVIAVQDGPDAGQTIQHVHVHIMPRRPNDFDENDGIYYELENQAGVKRFKVNSRTAEEMKREADQLRRFFAEL